MNSNNPEFDQLLEDMRMLHYRKSADYAQNGNPFSNFEEAAAATGLTVNKIFDVLVAIKDARIRELESSGKSPNNESIQDSYLDRLVYRALQLAWMRKEQNDGN